MKIQDAVMQVGLVLLLTSVPVERAFSDVQCAGGVQIKDTATNALAGCQYTTWNSSTCPNNIPGGMVPIYPTNNGFCLICLYEQYHDDVLSGDWSGLSPNVFSCMSCINKRPNNVGWWSFDESLGESYNLSEGILNNWDRYALPNNGFLFGDGWVRRAWQLDGVDDYVEVANHSSLNFGSNNFSFEGWIQLSSSIPYTSSHALLDKRVMSPYRGYHIALQNRKMVLQLADGGYTNWVSTVAIPNDDNWHHVAVTVNRLSSAGLTFYVDGQPAGTFSPLTRTGSLTTTANLRFGRSSLSSSGSIKMGMDEFSLYNRALTSTEIQLIFNSGRFGACKNIDGEGWWPGE